MISAGPDRCELCRLPLRADTVTLQLDDGPHAFCCPGCARVYDLARSVDMLEIVAAPRQKSGRQGIDFLLGRGETAYFTVDGMWCAGCAVSAERVVSRERGV